MTPLAAGARAPFTGLLFPSERAITLGSALETCEARAALDAQLAAAKEDLARRTCRELRDIGDTAAIEQQRILMQALEDAREASRREWWEQPAVLVTGGVVVGALVGAGLVAGAVAVVRFSVP